MANGGVADGKKRKAVKTVDDYLAASHADVRGVLLEVRTAIRTALPRADERIAYGMPAYYIDGRAVIYFAGWKAHYSVYPAPKALATLGAAAIALKVEKGTLRFPLDAPVPARLIARIARLRAKEEAVSGRRVAGSGRATVVRSR